MPRPPSPAFNPTRPGRIDRPDAASPPRARPQQARSSRVPQWAKSGHSSHPSRLLPSVSLTPPCSLMSIESEETPHCTVIRLHHNHILGPLQLQELEREIEQILTSQPGRGILLDCAALQAVSSAFLGRLVQWKQKTTAGGGDLKLCALQPIVRQVFQMSRLDQRLVSFSTQAEGLESFAPSA